MNIQFLERKDAPRLAYSRVESNRPGTPTLVFLGGFRSDMTGTKASFLSDRAAREGFGFLRFDYSGHGQSAARFSDRTLEDWRDDALAVIDRLTAGPLILIGSSMGGWLSLVLAGERADRLHGLVGIAAAPDFTLDLADTHFDDAAMESFKTRGFADMKTEYDPAPVRITRALIDAGNRICVLNTAHDMTIPMHLLQGQQDTEVDWTTPEKIRAAYPNAPISIHLIPDGDHSLSRPQDLEHLWSSIIDVVNYPV